MMASFISSERIEELQRRVDEVISVLSLLLSPGALDTSFDPVIAVDNLLQSNLSRVNDKLNTCLDVSWLNEQLSLGLRESHLSSVETPRYAFVESCVQLLVILKDTFILLSRASVRDSSCVEPGSTPVAESDLLSVRSRNIIKSALQFVFCLGIVPNLLPGVGIPLEKRTNFSEIANVNFASNISDLTKQHVLGYFVRHLLVIVEDINISNMVTTEFLPDMLAALYQLAFLPLKKENDGDCSATTETLLDTLVKEQKYWKHELELFLNKSHLSSVVKELFALQGSALQSDPKVIPAPSWLQRCCMRTVTKILMQKNGLQHVISGILDITLDSDPRNLSGDTSNWRKHDIVAKLIGTCPTYLKSAEYYYSKVCPQVLDLLCIQQKGNKQELIRIASGIISVISLKYFEVADLYLIDPLTKPLLKCSSHLHHEDEDIVVCEKTLTGCIKNLHAVFILGSDPNSPALNHLVKFWEILFYLAMFGKSRVSHLKTCLFDLLLRLLCQIDTELGVRLLCGLVFPEKLPQNVLSWNPLFCIVFGNDGGFEIHRKESDGCENVEWLEDDRNKIDTIIMLLESAKDDKIVSGFFLCLLESLSNVLKEDENPNIKSLSSHDPGLLLDIEENCERRLFSIRRSLLLFEMLKELAENPTLVDGLFQNKTSALHFIKSTLIRGSELCISNDMKIDSETLNMAMSFLVLFMSDELSIDLVEELKLMTPALSVLSEMHQDEHIREMAIHLKAAILTHGTMNPHEGKANFSEQMQNNHDIKVNVSPKPTVAEDGYKRSNLKQAWLELSGSDIPTIGHALLTLRKLVEVKDEEALKSKDKILEAFKLYLKHDDSYVYLNAIQGLASVADTYHGLVVPQLASEFADFSRTDGNSLEVRLKVAEVIVKITKDLGDITPMYRDVFLNSFLSACRDDDSLIRASSLSNLGEVCKNLRFSLGHNVHELFSCVGSLLTTDKAVEVRRAAGLFLTLLLHGLGKDSFQVLDAVLKELYRLLKRTLAHEDDELTKFHVQLCLEELDKIARDFLFPVQSLSKKIQVLDFS